LGRARKSSGDVASAVGQNLFYLIRNQGGKPYEEKVPLPVARGKLLLTDEQEGGGGKTPGQHKSGMDM